jgi:hypothetical protein
MASLFGSDLFFGEMFEFFLVFVLVFTVIFGIMQKTGFLSDRRDVNSVAAFVIAMVAALSGAVQFLAKVVPYYLLVFLVLFALMFLGKFIGYDMEKVFRSRYFVYTTIFVLAAIIIGIAWQDYAAGVAAQFNQTNVTNLTGVNLTGEPLTDFIATYNYECVTRAAFIGPVTAQNFWCIVLHPRVISALIVLAIAMVVSWYFVRSSRS